MKLNKTAVKNGGFPCFYMDSIVYFDCAMQFIVAVFIVIANQYRQYFILYNIRNQVAHI